MAAMKSTGHATSSMRLRVSDLSAALRETIQSHAITAKLPAAANIAIISQSSPACGIFSCLLLALHLQDSEERLLGNLHASDLLHALLPVLLLLHPLPL